MFEVNVNGRTQRYRTKPTMNVDTTGSSGDVSIPKPLTYDYMPEGYPKKDGWSIEWDGNTEGKTSVVSPDGTFYKISDMVLTYDDFLGAKYVIYEGEEQYSGMVSEADPSQHQDSDNICEFVFTSISFLVVSEDNAGLDGMIFPTKGLYVFYSERTKQFKLIKETITPMSTDFMPVVDDIIISSSTPDSTKKFKITVNDSGTISATEVT